MATLVLTAVGGIVGGPVGAAIGGVLGQAVDTRLLARKGRQGPRLADLSVQTSSYGTAIPPVFGTMRVAGTVIWATDLAEHRTTARGGKGQWATTTYGYTASFAVALSCRAIRGVGRVWADGTLIRGREGAFTIATTFRVHDGGEAQAVDPLIAAAEGAGVASAHRGLAYVVFENLALGDFGNRIPSLTFEVIADEGAVSAGAVAATMAGGVVTDEGAGPMLDGFVGAGDSARGVIEALALAGGAWFRDDGATLAMVAGAGGDAIVIEDAAVRVGGAGGGGGAERRTRAIAPADTVPRTLSVRHHDPARDGQIGVQTARRPGPGRRTEQVEVAAAMSAQTARGMAAAMLARAEAERTRRRVTLDISGATIAPGARVTVAGEGGVWRVARTTLEAMVTTLEIVGVAGAAPVLAASPGRALAQRDAEPGTTIVEAFEVPPLDDARPAVPTVLVAAGGTRAGWRRAALSWSLDAGATWSDLGTTAMPAVIGALAAPLRGGTTLLVDTATTIEVILANPAMTPVSAEAGAIDAGANLALIGDELVQFATAREIEAGHWRLGGLRRGVRATQVHAHGAGTRFVLVEAAGLVTLALPAGSVGRTVRILASGVDERDVCEAEVMVTGASILPPAPVAVRVGRLADGGMRATWVRRARAGGRWIDGVDVPLGEEREAYRCEVAVAGGSVRTVETESPSIVLVAADAVAGTTLAIRQIGTAGLSTPQFMTF